MVDICGVGARVPWLDGMILADICDGSSIDGDCSYSGIMIGIIVMMEDGCFWIKNSDSGSILGGR